MPSTITFTTKDICLALKIAKHQLRGWTEKLHPFVNANTCERSARKYTLSDLRFLAIIDYLDAAFGVSANKLVPLAKELNELINRPSTNLGNQKLLYISIDNCSCKWIGFEDKVTEGLVLDTNNAYLKINEYMGFSQKQVEMQLGLLRVG